MNEYKKQLQKGAIKAAYKGLMEYIMGVRVHFKNKYPDYFIYSKIIKTSKIENRDSFSFMIHLGLKFG